MRTALISVFLSVAAVLPASASNLDAKFLIKREGKVIGYHAVDVTQTAEGARADTRIRMRVKLGPVVLFRYDHASVEEWRGGEVVSIMSETKHNHRKMRLNARSTGDRLDIDGSSYEGPASLAALPSSYWNKALVSAPQMINTQNGEVMDISVTPVGMTKTANGLAAEQYQLVAENTLNLWYQGERWVGSAFVIEGEALTYELVDSPIELAQLEKILD